MRLICLALLVAGWAGLRAEVTIRTHEYHGWTNTLTISNGKVEAVIVPEVGRIMQFRFTGEQEGPFWENRALDGKSPDAKSTEWSNFGGDKTWPAPQADWPKVTGRGWPPPAAFDAMPVEAKVEGNAVVLRSAIDPHYGIRTERRVVLHQEDARMDVTTTYHKVEGEPSRVSIWVITQLKEPERVFMPIPPKTIFPKGYNAQSSELPTDLKVENGWVSCVRGNKTGTKIGGDAGELYWADAKWLVKIAAPREAGEEFPDNGSSAEIYTNGDPLNYVELELLGPLKTLKRGESIERTVSYWLYRRARDLNSQLEKIQVKD